MVGKLTAKFCLIFALLFFKIVSSSRSLQSKEGEGHEVSKNFSNLEILPGYEGSDQEQVH